MTVWSIAAATDISISTTDDPCTGIRRVASSTAITTATAICRSTCSAAASVGGELRKADIDASAGGGGDCRIVARLRASWPMCASCYVLIRLRSRSLDGLVRGQPGRLSVRSGAQCRLAAMIESELGAAGARRGERKAGAPLQGVLVDDAGQLVARAPGHRQGGMDQGEANPRFVVTSLGQCRGRRRVSTRRSIAPAATWRTGSRNARRSLRRPHLDRDHARQSAAAMVRLLRLRSAMRPAPHRPQAHAVRQGQLRNHSSQAAQDRRAGAHSVRRIKLAWPRPFKIWARWPCPRRKYRLPKFVCGWCGP